MRLAILIPCVALLCGTAAFAQDLTGPSKVTTLHVETVGHYSFTLEWTATGNDCGTGDPATYELYRSTSNITDTNWQQSPCVLLTSGSSCPNGKEHCELIQPGCPSGGSHYYAVFLLDSAGNRSPISNVVSGGNSCTGTHEADCYEEDCHTP